MKTVAFIVLVLATCSVTAETTANPLKPTSVRSTEDDDRSNASHGWGEATHGIQLSAYLKKGSYAIGEPIRARIRIRNLRKTPLDVSIAPPLYNCTVVVRDSSGQVVAPFDRYSKTTPYARYSSGAGTIASPGEEMTVGIIELNEWHNLQAVGAYSVSLHLDATSEDGKWHGKVGSNTVRFKVVKESTEDAIKRLGKPCGGVSLSAELRTTRDELDEICGTDEPITLQLRIKNAGSTPLHISDTVPFHSCTFVVQDAKGRDVGFTRRHARYKRHPYATGSGINIEPGKQYMARIRLNEWFVLNANGEYSVLLKLPVLNEDQETVGEALSNVVRFRIVNRPKSGS